MSEVTDPRIAAFAQQWFAGNAQAMKIEGFSEDDPPPPPPITRFVETTLSEISDDEVPSPPPSPLVALATAPTTTGTTATMTMTFPAPKPAELVVLDTGASYQGQEIQLSEEERLAVAQIVLRAIVNRAKAQYAQVTGTTPTVRVRRTRRNHAEEAPGSDAGVQHRVGRRKRGDGAPANGAEAPAAPHRTRRSQVAAQAGEGGSGVGGGTD